jgi:Fe2+ transport system protein B
MNYKIEYPLLIIGVFLLCMAVTIIPLAIFGLIFGEALGVGIFILYMLILVVSLLWHMSRN